MLIVKKSFRIGVHPDEKELVRKYLVEIGASILSVRYVETEIGAIPLARVYIDGCVENNRVVELIEWLDNNLKKLANITL